MPCPPTQLLQLQDESDFLREVVVLYFQV